MSETKSAPEPQLQAPDVQQGEIVSNKPKDIGFQYLAEHDWVSYTPEEDRRVRTRIDLHILPVVRICLDPCRKCETRADSR